MYKIYVVEDNQTIIDKITERLVSYGQNNDDFSCEVIQISDHFDTFVNANVHKASRENIYLLDIHLDDIVNGLTIAADVRKIDFLGNIVFLTSHIEMAATAYSYYLKATNFIDKSRGDYLRVLEETLDHIVSENMRRDSQQSKLAFKDRGRLHNITTDEILLIETSSIKRRLRVHTLTSTYTYPGTLASVAEHLPEAFKRVHRAFIVNVNNICEIDVSTSPHKIIFGNGLTCDISKKRISNSMTLLRYKESHEA